MAEITVNDLYPIQSLAQPQYHYGLIRVSSLVLMQADVSMKGCNTQGALENKGVFATVHQLLLLPKSYSIRGMFLKAANPATWDIWVESPDLPPTTDEYADPPEVVPIYRRDEDGSTHLLEMRIEKRMGV